MKKDNRFSVLRRNNRNIFCKADITTEELAEKLGISTGTISKLENECQEGQVPNTTATVLKAYHDKLGCSYEYLMGETKQENNKYANTATTMPFKMLSTQDIDNLAYIFSDPQYGSMYASLLSALLSKPEELKELLNSLVRSFKEIGDINSEKGYTKQIKEHINRPVRYTYTTMFAERIEEHFIPCMNKVFMEYNNAQVQDREAFEKHIATANLDNADFTTREYENYTKPIIVNSSSISNIQITKEPKDSQ